MWCCENDGIERLFVVIHCTGSVLGGGFDAVSALALRDLAYGGVEEGSSI